MAPDRHSLAGRSTLVLGASGFVGRWLLRALFEAGARPVAQVRDSARLAADWPGAEEVRVCDLEAPGAVDALVRAVRPEVVFDVAGYGVAKEEREPERMERLNAGLPARLAAALLEEAPEALLVHVGSALEYGAEARSLDEAAPACPTTDYGRTKLAATEALLAARAGGLATLTARAFTLFGLGERPGRLVPSLLAARGGDGRIPLSAGTQKRDWIYVEDAVRALLGLAEAPPARVRAGEPPFDAPAINLASGALRTVREFTELFAKLFDIRPERLGFGDLPGLAEEMFHPPVPVERLRAAVGWTPPTDPLPAFRRMRDHLSNGVPA